MIGPDGVIAPWLDAVAPRTLLVVGPTLPLLADYAASHPVVVETSPSTDDALTGLQKRYDAVLMSEIIASEDAVLLAGIARNQLAPDVLTLVRPTIPATALFALGYVRYAHTEDRDGPLLSFRYTLATYNHTRSWNNPKFWANPERWNKHWW